MMLLAAMWTSRTLQATVEWGIADMLPKDGGASVSALAELTGADPGVLGRMLRALSAYGVFALAEDGRWVHTAESLVLRTDHPHTICHLAKLYGDELNWKTCAAMTEAVRTGRETFQLEFGRPMWAYLQDKPADAVTFQQGMTDLSHFLHVFEDDVAVRVLTNCAAAARPGARIVAMERVIADDPKYTFGKILDLMILCFTQGRERTEDESAHCSTGPG